MREADHVTLLADDPVALIDVPVLAEAQGWSAEVIAEMDHHRYELSRLSDDRTE